MNIMKSFIFTGALLCLTAAANAQQSDTSRAETAALLADAQQHSSLSGAQSSGHDNNGFYLANDGFRLNINGDMQYRYTLDTNRDGGKDNNVGFNIPLMRLRFSGELNSTIDFMLEADFNRTNGTAILRNAYAGFKPFEGARFQVGQFKLPFLYEDSMPDRYQLAIDKSVTAYIFGQGYSQGVQFTYDFGNFRIAGALSDGFRTANTDYTNPTESDFAITLRGDYVIFGSRNDFTQFTATREEENALLAGAAFHYQNANGLALGNDTTGTADLNWKYHGWDAFASFVGRDIKQFNTTYNDFGLVLQGGYRVTENFEPYIRYDAVLADSSRALPNNNFNFITTGANYYIMGQAAKISADVIWSLDQTTGLNTLGDFSNTGLLGSTGKNELAFRMQLQVLF